MSVLNRCLLSLLVVLAAGACLVHGQERIKMCGRDLIRLAISSCGNSRARRSIAASQQRGPGQPAGDHVLPIQGHWGPSETIGAPFQLDHHQHSHQDLEQEANQDQEQDRYRGQDQDQDQDQDQNQEVSTVPNWYIVSSRVRRTAGRISDVCCEKGCSLRELIQFC